MTADFRGRLETEKLSHWILKFLGYRKGYAAWDWAKEGAVAQQTNA